MPEEQIEYKFDTQLLIEGSTATEDEINDYITEHFEGDWAAGSSSTAVPRP